MPNDSKASFKNFGLSQAILSSLNKLGYKTPSLIQQKCIPYLLQGRDVLGISQTGSGKTAAFVLPILNNINFSLKFSQALILAPTRELVIQIRKFIINFSKKIKTIKIISIYGGQSYSKQIKMLKYNPQIIVGTPGRLLDLLNKKILNLNKIKSLVLDEADKMLKMGFLNDVKNIVKKTPNERQTALFSATMPFEIRRITQKFTKFVKEINIQSTKNTLPDIDQYYCLIKKIRKTELLIRFLEIENFKSSIVFVKTKNSSIEISRELEKNGYNSAALNGDINQSLREKIIEHFRNGIIDILVATDIAARGLDIKRIKLVINYDIPLDPDSYIHRIGRTGRAGTNGKTIVFVRYNDIKILKNIEKYIKCKILELKAPSLSFLNKKRQDKFVKNLYNYIENIDNVDNIINQYQPMLEKIKKEKKINDKTLLLILLQIMNNKFSTNKNNCTIYNQNKNKIFLKRNFKNIKK